MMLSESLPFAVLSIIAWFAAYEFGSRPLAKMFLGSSVPTDRETCQLSRTNALSIVHALVVAPIGLYLTFWNDWENAAPSYKPWPLTWCFIFSCGYFALDVSLCCRYCDVYGYSFLFHGILSIFGVIAYLASIEVSHAGVFAAMLATEVSTIFLHLRWFLIQRESFGYKLQMTNAAFLMLFVCYRLYYAGYKRLNQIILEFQPVLELSSRTSADKLSLAFIYTAYPAWSMLNYYWGYLLVKTQTRLIQQWLFSSKIVKVE